MSTAGLYLVKKANVMTGAVFWNPVLSDGAFGLRPTMAQEKSLSRLTVPVRAVTHLSLPSRIARYC